jgi:hypothetical protein
MRTSGTQNKLTEAAFFLDHMKKNAGKLHKFNYFLNAFISAARAVHWVMRHEYVYVPGWLDWQETKDKNLPDEVQVLLKQTTTMRNNAVKRGTLAADASYVITMPPFDLARLFKMGEGQVLISLVGDTMKKYRMEVVQPDGEREDFPFIDVPGVRREVKECPGQDVLYVCHTYYDLLAGYVKECTEKFGLPPK